MFMYANTCIYFKNYCARIQFWQTYHFMYLCFVFRSVVLEITFTCGILFYSPTPSSKPICTINRDVVIKQITKVPAFIQAFHRGLEPVVGTNIIFLCAVISVSITYNHNSFLISELNTVQGIRNQIFIRM